MYVGKYTSPMDPMGSGYRKISCDLRGQTAWLRLVQRAATEVPL